MRLKWVTSVDSSVKKNYKKYERGLIIYSKEIHSIENLEEKNKQAGTKLKP